MSTLLHRDPFQLSASVAPSPVRFAYEPTAMQEVLLGHETQNSWPVGAAGFGVGTTDQPRPEALAGASGFGFDTTEPCDDAWAGVTTSMVSAHAATTHLFMVVSHVAECSTVEACFTFTSSSI